MAVASYSPECGHYVFQFPEDEDPHPVGVFVDDLNSNQLLTSLWIYVESNGHPRIQRDDSFCTHEGVDESNRDTILLGIYATEHGETVEIHSDVLP